MLGFDRPGCCGVFAARLAVVLFFALGQASYGQSVEILVPGRSVERPLIAGGADIYEAELEAGKPWRARVEQVGIDVIVEVKDPRGQSLLKVDQPLEREGTESLLLTPAASGLHRIEVRCEKESVPAGRYLIRLDELASATPEDRLRLDAEAAMSDAGRLYAGQETDAREEAMARLGEALEIWRALGAMRQEARTHFLIGRHFDLVDDYRPAAVNYEQALFLWRRLGDDSGVAATLDRLGFARKNLGEIPRALDDLREAVALRRDLGQREREAATRNRLCLALQVSGRPHAAGDCYEETLGLARELVDTGLEATLLNNLGGVFRNLGEPEREFAYLRQALELRSRLGDERGEAITRNNLGAFHRRLGEVEEALRLYASALATFEKIGNRYWQARTLNNIGFAYLSLGELERARSYFLRALPLRRAVGDRRGEAVTLLNLGRASSGLDETGKALAFFQKALEHNLAIDNRRAAAVAHQLIGELRMEEHDTAAARGELELALAILQETGNRAVEGEVLELLARVQLENGEYREAAILAVEALDLARAVRDPTAEVAALTTRARVERRRGRNRAAHEHLEAALAALEAVHGQLGDPLQRASFLASRRRVYELQVDLLMELHRSEPEGRHDLTALAASERARSRSLLGLLGSAGAGPGSEIEPALAQRLRFAERRFAAKTRRQLEVLGQAHTAEKALLAEQELYTALNELDHVRAEIRRRSPRYASLSRSHPLDAAAVRALLDDDTVLLEFLLGEKRSFLWWVTPAAVTAYELPPRQRIEELAGQVHREVSAIHQRGAATWEALDALGRILLAPIAGRLRDQRLVIVADGALHFVPFAALPLPGDHQPMLTRHEVVYLPSASVLAAQRQELPTAVAPVKTLAILADPIFDRQDPRFSAGVAGESETGLAMDRTREAGPKLDEIDRLPHTRQEAEAIAALVPPGQRLLATGGDARRSRVVGDELGGYRILHFATHGFVNPRAPELSGLVLSRFDADGARMNGFLGLHDVSNLELAAELVVLSGCRTALGKEIRGEGLVGLTRGFMYAGVPRVVASLWQVRDQATAELMARFYHAMLIEGLTPAAALRTAQLELRQERRYRDPFYWAAFSLQGDWR